MAGSRTKWSFGPDWFPLSDGAPKTRMPSGPLERIVMRLIFAAALAAALMLGAPGIGRAQDDGDSDPGSTAFNNGDYATAMKDWRAKAAQSDPEAMTNIGTLYNLGLGTHKDLNEAGKWYEK